MGARQEPAVGAPPVPAMIGIYRRAIFTIHNLSFYEIIKRTLWDALYIPAIVSGLGITLRHFLVNTFGSKEIETIRYGEPELKDYVPNPKKPDGWRGKKKNRDLPERHRGQHRLMKRPDGEVRCTACMMCATACPAQCITIEAGERENPTNRSIEKYPVKFDIDELRCIYCGMCEEACPVDAIELTPEYQVVGRSREEMIFDKEKLLSVYEATKDKEPMRSSRMGGE